MFCIPSLFVRIRVSLAVLLSFPNVQVARFLTTLNGKHHVALVVSGCFVLRVVQSLPQGVPYFEVDLDVVVVEDPFSFSDNPATYGMTVFFPLESGSSLLPVVGCSCALVKTHLGYHQTSRAFQTWKRKKTQVLHRNTQFCV